jgi:hypothetical protein
VSLRCQQGLAIGNGWVDSYIQTASYADYAYSRGLIDQPTKRWLTRQWRACLETTEGGTVRWMMMMMMMMMMMIKMMMMTHIPSRESSRYAYSRGLIGQPTKRWLTRQWRACLESTEGGTVRSEDDDDDYAYSPWREE